MKNELLRSELIEALEARRSAMKQQELAHEEEIRLLHPNYQDCARNLIHYLTLRTFKMRRIQGHLSNIGLSSFSSSEGYAMADLNHVLQYLHLMNGTLNEFQFDEQELQVDYFRSKDILKENTIRLFGETGRRSGTSIMVTMPTEAATDTRFIDDLLDAGMNIARINCSHDDPQVWDKMIQNVKRGSVKKRKSCLIYMDIAGPKLRTGPIEGWTLSKKNRKKTTNYLTLLEGDILEISRSPVTGTPALLDDEGKVKLPAKISITLPAVLDDLKIGHQIWFDDGKIGGEIIRKQEDSVQVKIIHAHLEGSKLRAEKGVNLPDTTLNLNSLTDYDIQHLPYVAEHADIIGYSFVRKPEDIAILQQMLAEIKEEDKGIVLKIETKDAFDQLPALLMQAMKSPKIGVMIARGDLAVEIGFDRIAEVQEQIMWVCEAAHVPIIWATQVLDRLAKKGLATRAEVTDAAMSSRAECVMLNKGPYIIHAVSTLDSILQRMKYHQTKKKGSFRRLNVARRFIDRRIENPISSDNS